MLYTIKITNKNVDLNSPDITQLYLDGISPSLISNLTTAYEDFMTDMAVSDTSLYVPIYERNQVVEIPESSVLIISTDNSSEAVYYRSLKLNNSLVLVDPDPITGSSSDPVLIDKYISENGVYHATDDGADGYSTVNVDVSGGGGISGNDVVFYDYDGSVVTSYSAAEFVQLSSIPANPSHTGLTAQGWNWTLADAKSYVASYGKLNIGQMYITSDGKTRLYFTVTKDNLSAELYLELGPDTELDIDWGDGSEHTRWTSADGDSSKSHEYASAGRYVIAIEVITGEFYFSQALSNIYKIEIGNGAVGISDYGFSYCSALSSITIPDGLTSIGSYAFSTCYALSLITIPDSVTSIGSNSFYECPALSTITFGSSTPPELSSSLDIYNICIIRVPQGSLSDYTSASNYPDPSEYIYEEY